MSSNKSAKQELIKLYGAECFIEKLHLRNDKNRHYTSKGQMKRMKQLTYHHIEMRKNGGKATIENGALLTAENHSWFHQQSEEKQKEMNRKFQEYKKSIDNRQKCKIQFSDNIGELSDLNINLTEISFSEELEVKKAKFNRAEVKRETQKLIDEEICL